MAGTAGVYVDRASTAPWTRPSSEFVAPFGMFTAAEFALVARRHMHRYGTKPDALATVAAVIRNNGAREPGRDLPRARAVHAPGHPRQPHGRRPVPSPRLRDRVGGWLRSRADAAPTSPLMLPTTPGVRARGQRRQRRHRVPEPADVGARAATGDADLVNGTVGRRAAEDAFRAAGLGPTDVDVCEFYDPFSFEIIRQYEAFGFCGEGEGGDFVTSGTIEPGGQYPGHHRRRGDVVQPRRRVGADAAARHPRRRAAARHVRDQPGRGAEVAMCSNGGSGALFTDVMLLGVDRP